MKPRLLSTLLLVPLIAGLTACDDRTVDQAVEKPSAVATSTAPSPSVPPTAAEICAKVDVAFNDFTSAISAAIDGSGKVPPATAKKAYGDLALTLTKLADEGQPGKAATDLKAFSAEAARVSKLPSPWTGKVDPGFDKAAAQAEKDCATT
ncbi:hypothetical protein [Actinoplanes solisilvae]|uniref:hypothetical protein n=1 Tax=Actinoplanes solisilvae TaxID=2486853 RepID=UPI0013E2CB68|nr:hypothetical protein [Actinoplanes solisilvae]